jgi:hypothetical protein
MVQLVEVLRYKPEGLGVRFQMASLDRNMTLGFTQALTEMSTRNGYWCVWVG